MLKGLETTLRYTIWFARLVLFCKAVGEETEICSGKLAIKIEWPHPGLIQPLMIFQLGVQATVSGHRPGTVYHAYLHHLPHERGQSHYKEFVGSDMQQRLAFELPDQLADGPLHLRLQVVARKLDMKGGTLLLMRFFTPATPLLLTDTGCSAPSKNAPIPRDATRERTDQRSRRRALIRATAPRPSKGRRRRPRSWLQAPTERTTRERTKQQRGHVQEQRRPKQNHSEGATNRRRPQKQRPQQVFSAGGCHEGTAWANGTVRRDMGMADPPCPACLFTTGWARSNFT